jgi:hypothetical protein
MRVFEHELLQNTQNHEILSFEPGQMGGPYDSPKNDCFDMTSHHELVTFGLPIVLPNRFVKF